MDMYARFSYLELQCVTLPTNSFGPWIQEKYWLIDTRDQLFRCHELYLLRLIYSSNLYIFLFQNKNPSLLDVERKILTTVLIHLVQNGVSNMCVPSGNLLVDILF